jgi:hypothetical protein
MNTLTKNRILQEGDEMYAGGEWNPIPATEFGLQVEFSKYAKYKIRRPSEPESTKQNGAEGTPAPAPATPEAPNKGAAATAKPDGKPSAPPLVKPRPLSETYGKAKPKVPKVLPTVVSKRAHDPRSGEKPRVVVRVVLPKARPAPTPTPTGKAIRNETSIPFSDLSAKPDWIGRNGTFKATAIRLAAKDNGLIQIRPEGSRGLAKNALIEFPAADIPKVIDWLLRNQLPSTSTL